MNPQDKAPNDEGETTQTGDEQQPASDTAASPALDPSPVPEARGRGIAWLALLLALLAIGLAGYTAWQWYRVDEARDTTGSRLERLAQALDQVQQDVATALERAGEAATATEAAAGQWTRVENQLTAMQSGLESLRQAQDAARAQRRQLTQRLDKVSPGSGIRQLKLAEAAFLMRSAYQTLALSHDPEPAAQTLALADARLAGLQAPGLQAVRRALQEEIQALKAVPEVDVPGLSARLHTLIRRVPELPLRNALGEHQFDGQAPEASQDQGWWQATQDFLGRYFTVRRTEQSGTDLPAPETLHLLREQLQLKLEQARLALLQSSPELYSASLQQARAWLQRYFDPDHPGVQAALDEINALQAIEIKPSLPETGAALRALEAVQASFG